MPAAAREHGIVSFAENLYRKRLAETDDAVLTGADR